MDWTNQGRKGYKKKDPNCPCIFTKRSGSEFDIIVVYVDDLNIINTLKKLSKAIECLRRESKMKRSWKDKILSWPIDWEFDEWIFCPSINIHRKFLMWFYMDKSHSLSTPMIMRSLDINKDSLWSQKKDEEILGDETLMHLVNNTRPYIRFAINLLARFSSSPTKGHWNGVKHILE